MAHKALFNFISLPLLDDSLFLDLNFLDISKLIVNEFLNAASSRVVEVRIYEVILRFADVLLLRWDLMRVRVVQGGVDVGLPGLR